MSISDPKPIRPTQEPRRDDLPPFPTKFGHARRRPQPPPGDADAGDDVRPSAPDEDPFEDDGGL